MKSTVPFLAFLRNPQVDDKVAHQRTAKTNPEEVLETDHIKVGTATL